MPTNHSQRSFPERNDSLRTLEGQEKAHKHKKEAIITWDPGPQVRTSGDEKIEDPSGPPAGTRWMPPHR